MRVFNIFPSILRLSVASPRAATNDGVLLVLDTTDRGEVQDFADMLTTAKSRQLRNYKDIGSISFAQSAAHGNRYVLGVQARIHK